MEPIFLSEVERGAKSSPAGQELAAAESQDIPVPQILYLFGFQPQLTQHLSRFTQELMRGPSPLSPGMRELIAALTSSRNQCPF